MVPPMISLRPGALSDCCRALGLSREALSRRMGVSPSTLYRIDRGDSLASARVIGLLIRETGRSFDQLFYIHPTEQGTHSMTTTDRNDL